MKKTLKPMLAFFNFTDKDIPEANLNALLDGLIDSEDIEEFFKKRFTFVVQDRDLSNREKNSSCMILLDLFWQHRFMVRDPEKKMNLEEYVAKSQPKMDEYIDTVLTVFAPIAATAKKFGSPVTGVLSSFSLMRMSLNGKFSVQIVPRASP